MKNTIPKTELFVSHLTTRHCSHRVELILDKCKLIVRRKNGNPDDGQKNKKYCRKRLFKSNPLKKEMGETIGIRIIFKNLAELKRTDSEYYELQNVLNNDELIDNVFLKK